MALNHFDIATEGLRRDHRWISRLGFFQFEVITPPIDQMVEMGGGLADAFIPYEIKVSLSYKGKIYTQTRLIDYHENKRLIKIFMKLKRVRKAFDRTLIFIKYIGYTVKDITVNIFRRKRK